MNLVRLLQKFFSYIQTKSRSKKRSSGFSIVEFLIVVTLIGILAGIAIPSYNHYTKKARIGVAKSMIYSMKRARQIEEATNTSTSAQDLWKAVESDKKDAFTPVYVKAGSLTSPSWCLGLIADSNAEGYSTDGWDDDNVEPFTLCLDSRDEDLFRDNSEEGSGSSFGRCNNSAICE